MRKFNKGTNVGKALIKKSIRQLGCARSIVLDKENNVLCGSEVLNVAQELNIPIVTIETSGDVLIAVKRVDVASDSKKAREIALVDNLAQEKNLNFDADNILAEMDDDISFDPRVWNGYECIVKELNLHDLLVDSVEKKEKAVKREEDVTLTQELTLFD